MERTGRQGSCQRCCMAFSGTPLLGLSTFGEFWVDLRKSMSDEVRMLSAPHGEAQQLVYMMLRVAGEMRWIPTVLLNPKP